MTKKVSSKEEKLVHSENQSQSGNLSSPIDKPETTVLECIKSISVISYPTTLFYICIYLQQTIILSFIGKKYSNDKMVAGIGASNLYCNCFVTYLAIGLSAGCETLCSNAYSLKKFYLLGLYIHRARLITFIIIFSFCVFHYFYAIKLIGLLPLDKDVVNYAGEYLNYNMLYGLMEIQFGLNFRIINIAEKSLINIYILIASISLHPLWCYIYITKLDFGVAGAGLASISSQFINMVGTSLYLHFAHPIPESYFCINKDVFKGWCEYLKFAVPAAFLLCSEWLSFEIQGIFALLMSTLDYETYILVYNVTCLLYTLIVGKYMATTILVGKFVADNTIENLKKMFVTCFIYGSILIVIAILPVLFLQGKVLYIFTSNEEIIDLGKDIIIYMCVASIFDMLQTILCSICRGLGQQVVPSIFAFVQFYLVQTILTWYLGLHLNYGVKGIFMSSCVGLGLSTICFAIIILTLDLNEIKQETLKRIKEDELNQSQSKSILKLSRSSLKI